MGELMNQVKILHKNNYKKFKRNMPFNIEEPIKLPPNQNEAALIIQKWWQAQLDRAVFKFYKDLIGFHTKMMSGKMGMPEEKDLSNNALDPKTQLLMEKSSLVTATSKQCAATILRLIAPKEAHLMDEAAGTHIRFRLGASSSGSFPPTVYYKIYTHRPIIDLCATAPRNYTIPANKTCLPKQRFNEEKNNSNNNNNN